MVFAPGKFELEIKGPKCVYRSYTMGLESRPTINPLSLADPLCAISIDSSI